MKTKTPQLRRKRCSICKQFIAGAVYKFNGPRSYACEQCLRDHYESQDRERWTTPEEFDRFFEEELLKSAVTSAETCFAVGAKDQARRSTKMPVVERSADPTQKIPQRDPAAAYVRKTTAALRVGDGAECAECRESRPEALIANSNPITCAACDRKKTGKTPIDNHHPFGKANHPATIPVPVNDHRAELSPAQYDWPNETRENPDGSPLLAGAACIRGFIDTVYYLVRTGLLWIAEALEWLHAHLVKHFGPKWWIGTPLEKFAPKR